jgi:ferredoxin
VENADDHVVLPCDCKTIQMACDYPVEVCVRLNDAAKMTLEHGLGRRVTKEEMKRIVIEAHRIGLMQTGSRDWSLYGDKPFGFCNCCSCCCYPIVAGDHEGLHRAWPRAHYLAERDPSKCSSCGDCHDRCHFNAFEIRKTATLKDGTLLRSVKFVPERCIGCGLCATTCPESAITMVQLTPEQDAEIRAIYEAKMSGSEAT